MKMDDAATHSQTETRSDPPPDLADALSQIQDDEDQTLEAEYWAVDQILAGVLPEAIAADLVEQGWAPDRAEEIAEQARRLTRGQRGVVTREDIASGANAKYRRSQRRTAILIRLVLLGFAILIIWAVAKLNATKTVNLFENQSAKPRSLE